MTGITDGCREHSPAGVKIFPSDVLSFYRYFLCLAVPSAMVGRIVSRKESGVSLTSTVGKRPDLWHLVKLKPGFDYFYDYNQ